MTGSALTLGFVLHVLWHYLIYFYAERECPPRFAVVPVRRAIGQLETDRQRRLDRAEAPGAARNPPLQRDRRRFFRRFARRMGSLPGRRRARRADRLPGQAIVRIADRPGRARPSVGKQLRLAASGARLFLPEGLGRFPRSRVALLPFALAAHGGGRARHPDRGHAARSSSARSASATPARGSPSTSSAPCARSIGRGRARGRDDQRRRRADHPGRRFLRTAPASTSCRRSSTSSNGR